MPRLIFGKGMNMEEQMTKNERRGFWKVKKETLDRAERAELVERLRKLAETESSKDVVTSWCYYRSPDRVGKERMKTLNTIYECLCRTFAHNLTALVRAYVDVKPAFVEQLAYSEFIYGLDSPTYFNLLRAEPLKESWLLDINPSILYPLIDLRLNGGKEPVMTSHRSLIEVEKQFAGGITKTFLQELKHACEIVAGLKLEFEIIQTESDLQLIQVVLPNEIYVVLCFDIVFGDKCGSATLAQHFTFGVEIETTIPRPSVCIPF